ncbi:MAG: hypothetical protein JRI36_10250 [Deltaproteobacteria bacterium]|nr:hypothetical protein [Deltaproteobacteria bacterium]
MSYLSKNNENWGPKRHPRLGAWKRALKSFVLILITLIGLWSIVATGGGGGSSGSSGSVVGSGE